MVYKYCLQTKILLVLNLMIIQFIYISCGQILDIIIGYLGQVFIFAAIKLIKVLLQKEIQNDNEQAIRNLQQNIKINGYLQNRVDYDDIDGYISQQTTVAYIYFLLYQVLLLIVKVTQHESSSESQMYSLIHLIKVTYPIY